MNRTQIPVPPNPASFGSIPAWQAAVFQWMLSVKGRIETDSVVNTQPIAPFVVSTYTAVSTVTGTDALSNFVATLVAGMQAQGITAPNSQRIG
jgi:hypothetical protein